MRRRPAADGVAHAADAVRDHRGAAGLRFHGDDAEVLVRRKQERPCAAHVLSDIAVR